MEEKKTIKIRLSTFFLILAIIAIIVMGYFIFSLSNENEKSANKIEDLNSKLASVEKEKISLQSEITNNNSEQSIEKTDDKNNVVASNSNIKVNEKVALYNHYDDVDNYLFYGYIDDGNLYYIINKGQGQFNNNSINNFTKFDKITNIKKIELYNSGTSVDEELMLLTEDGKIYQIHMESCFQSGEVDNLELLEIAKNYDVKDFKFEDDNKSFNLVLTLNGDSEKTLELFSYPQ